MAKPTSGQSFGPGFRGGVMLTDLFRLALWSLRNENAAIFLGVHQTRASPCASGFSLQLGYRKEFRGGDQFFPF